MGTLISTRAVSSKPINTVAYSSDGGSLAVGGGDSTLRVFDTASGGVSSYSTPGQQVTKVAFSAETGEVAAAAQDLAGSGGSIYLVGSGAQLLGANAISGHTGRVSGVDFAPDGRTIASSSLDLTARTWDVASRQQLQVFLGHDVLPSSVATGVWCVRFAPDGRTLATGGSDRTVRLWDAASGKELRKIQAANGVVFGVAFSPDGGILAASSEDASIKLFDPSSGQLIKTLAGHTDWVVSIEFSPDGSKIASAGYDGTARLWDVASGTQVDLISRGDKVHDVAFSPNGRGLATGGEDGSVKEYRI